MLPWDAQQPHTPHSRFERRDRFLSPRQKHAVKSWKGVLGSCHAGWDVPLGVRYFDRQAETGSEGGSRPTARSGKRDANRWLLRDIAGGSRGRSAC